MNKIACVLFLSLALSMPLFAADSYGVFVRDDNQPAQKIVSIDDQQAIVLGMNEKTPVGLDTKETNNYAFGIFVVDTRTGEKFKVDRYINKTLYLSEFTNYDNFLHLNQAFVN